MTLLKPDPNPTPAHAILANIAAGMSAEHDLHGLLQRFLEPVVRLTHAQAGSVRLLSEDENQLRLVGHIGPVFQWCDSGAPVERHCGFCGTAADQARIVWTASVASCRARAAASEPAMPPARMVTVPLQHRGHVYGVYNLYYTSAEKPGPDVMALLTSVGELLGLALNNARLEAESLHAQLVQERQRMAADMHDSVGQSLACVKMRLPLLHDAMRAHDDDTAQRYYDDVRTAVTQAHAGLRSLLTHLRSPMSPQGLVHALDTAAQRFRHTTGAQLDFVNELPELRLSEDHEAQIFHIVQEALTNVARHAAARYARLHIGAAKAGEVEIVVEDDGAGLPSAAGAGGSHYGMEIMFERARRIGGTLEIGARQGGGTRVRLAMALPEGAGRTRGDR